MEDAYKTKTIDFKAIDGLGIKCKLQYEEKEYEVLIGSKNFLDQNECILEQQFEFSMLNEKESCERQCKTVIFVAIDKKYVALMVIVDQVCFFF